MSKRIEAKEQTWTCCVCCAACFIYKLFRSFPDSRQRTRPSDMSRITGKCLTCCVCCAAWIIRKLSTRFPDSRQIPLRQARNRLIDVTSSMVTQHRASLKRQAESAATLPNGNHGRLPQHMIITNTPSLVWLETSCGEDLAQDPAQDVFVG